MAAANAIRGHGSERHGDDRPAACGAGRIADPATRRKRDRRGGRIRGGVERHVPGEHRHRRRSVCADLRREGKEGLSAERQRHRTSRIDAGAHAVAWLQGEPHEFWSRFRHAVGRHSHRHRAGIALGLAGSAHAVRDENLQGRVAARDRLRGAGISDHRRNRQRLAHEERAPARRLLQGRGSGFSQDVLHQWRAADDRDDFQESGSGEDTSVDPGAGARRLLQRRSGARDRGEVDRRSAVR